MSRTNFENLRVYKLSEELADTIWDIVVQWDSFAKQTVGKQIVRAADSVGANISEGTGRGSFQDNRRFVRVARGSLNETQHFLRRAFKRKAFVQTGRRKIETDRRQPRSPIKLVSKIHRLQSHTRLRTRIATDHGLLTTNH
jgi:four helix bundle protein